MRVVVTGANGFIGRGVCAALSRRGHQAVACLRVASSGKMIDCADVIGIGPLEGIGDSGQSAGLARALRGADTIIHLAGWSGGRSGQITEDAARAVNVGATARLAEAAERAGVPNLIFMSSVKAMGSATKDMPFTPDTPPAPTDLYGQTKLEAERALAGVRGLSVTVIRPPIVYGAGMKGNLMTFFNLAARRVPLPLAAIRNARDLLALASLTDLVVRCVEAPGAGGRVSLACDGTPMSSGELYKKIGVALNRRVSVFPLPPALLRIATAVIGRSDIAESVLSSLVIDDSQTRSELGWKPVVSLEAGLKSVAEWYLSGAVHDSQAVG